MSIDRKQSSQCGAVQCLFVFLLAEGVCSSDIEVQPNKPLVRNVLVDQRGLNKSFEL